MGFLHMGEDFTPPGFIGHVKRERFASDSVGNLPGQCDVAIGDDDGSTLFGKAFAIGATQPHCAAGYQRDLARYSPCHGIPRFSSGRLHRLPYRAQHSLIRGAERDWPVAAAPNGGGRLLRSNP